MTYFIILSQILRTVVYYCIMRPYTDGPIGPLSYRHSSGVVRNPHSTLAEWGIFNLRSMSSLGTHLLIARRRNSINSVLVTISWMTCLIATREPRTINLSIAGELLYNLWQLLPVSILNLYILCFFFRCITFYNPLPHRVCLPMMTNLICWHGAGSNEANNADSMTTGLVTDVCHAWVIPKFTEVTTKPCKHTQNTRKSDLKWCNYSKLTLFVLKK